MNKGYEFLTWCERTRLFSSVDCKRWGLDHFYARADRTARDFCTKGILRRLPDNEKRQRGLVKKGCVNLAWYVYI